MVGGEFGISSGHLLPPRHGAQLLLPELGGLCFYWARQCSERGPLVVGGCCELGTQQHETFSSSCLAGSTFRNASNAVSPGQLPTMRGGGAGNTVCTILTKHWHLYQPAGDRGCCLASVVSIQAGGNVGVGVLRTADLNLAIGCCLQVPPSRRLQRENGSS